MCQAQARMAALLAAISAVAFGVSDFYGGVAARRTVVFASTAVAQATGLVTVIVISVIVGGHPTATDWGWGFVAGTASGFSILLFYWALSAGQMSVVAPVAALMSGIVPVIAGVVQGERPSLLSLVGIALALPAIVLISREPGDPHAAGGVSGARRWISAPVGAALVAGIGFGLFFVAISRAGDHSGVWPLVSARIVAITVVFTLALITRAGRPAAAAVVPAMVAGGLEAVANGLFIAASRAGLLSLVGVIGAMYPASTVVMARLLLGERMARHQEIGLGLAAAAVIIVSLPS